MKDWVKHLVMQSLIRFTLLLLVGLLVLWLAFFVFKKLAVNQSATNLDRDVVSGGEALAHPARFFDATSFYPAVERLDQTELTFVQPIAGGVIPHHLLASDMIADFFKRLAPQQPKTIILLGPNHYERGGGNILTSQRAWETSVGMVQPNSEVIQELLESNMVTVDEEVLPADHSIAGLLPFVAYFLPQTRVVPLLISDHTTKLEWMLLADALTLQMEKNPGFVVVASVDFSHNLTSNEAQEKDAETIQYIHNFEWEPLAYLGNEHADSPKSLAVLLLVAQALGKTQVEVLQHTNSGEITRDPSAASTSYFELAIY